MHWHTVLSHWFKIIIGFDLLLSCCICLLCYSMSYNKCTTNRIKFGLNLCSMSVFYYIQIVTGIEVNSESYFPKLREYCPSAEGTRAIFQQLREIRLTIDR